MSIFRSLTLYRPGELPDRTASSAPRDVPSTIPDGDLLLNHSILAAELLGLDPREAQEALDNAGRASTEALSAYHEDDAEILARLLSAVNASLREATNSSGVPTGPMGERLAASPLMMRDGEGRLLFKSHRVPVADLRQRLPALQRMLSFAAESGLWLRIGERP